MPPKNRRDYNETRALITKAVETLRKNKRNETLADAVEYTLTPDFVASARYELVEKTSSGDKNLPIGCTVAYREHMKAAAVAAGTSLTDAVRLALTELADGEFTPTRPTRAKHGTAKGQTKTNINTRQDPALITRAEARCAQLADEFDWTPKLNSAVKEWLEVLYGAPEADAGE
ncbi:hypothetical protein [Streptomyces sp. NPDC093589]|uniref:hypothetical protein n=1 Tax=Streptomyces sp. NPDC093589 TaxID=3366043 RepID=UPI0038043B2E